MNAPSIPHMIAWLKTQPPETTYDWWSVNDCVFGRYFKSCNVWDDKHVKGINAIIKNDRFKSFIDFYARIGNGGYPAEGVNHTYGEALHRAEHLMRFHTPFAGEPLLRPGSRVRVRELA